MGDLKYLPEAVRSSVRSGIIIFDLNRVVEELIFNSLDAGATKISVAVDAGTCYVKVVDNGCGITRDGLMLLGERYATSKIDQLADTNSVIGSFGFRGEALSSISDVSLLEVITKAHGRPNGYRKVMKGCKCLYLGIDDSRQDVGTTVIVRDLFYNQPVRRKHIQSSTKKVLQSVKKCVLRIALVHPRVLFKVVDINSDEELLCTTPSSSPLSLLMSGFGIEVSSSLHELNVSDGTLKLSGYMHISRGTCSLKAFQYVYINSRYTCKGPIHKLLNQLATGFNSLDLQNANIGSRNAKRSRSQTYATYILNISCPRSSYDLTFEPSKTSVEFKDWFPIISFIENAITQFWSEKFSYDGPLSHVTDMSGQDMQTAADNTLSPEEDLLAIEKRCRIHSHPPFGLPSPWLEMQTEESDLMSYRKDNRGFCRSALEFKDQQTGFGFVDPTEYSFHGLSAPSRVSVNQEHGSYLPGPHSSIFSAEDCFLGNKLAQAENFNEHADCIFGSRFEDEHLYVDAKINSSYTGSAPSSDCFKISDDVDKVSTDFKKPFLHSCSSWRSLSLDGESLVSSEKFDFQTLGVRTKRKRLEPDDWVDVRDVDIDQTTFDFRGRTLWQDDATSMWSPPGRITKRDVRTRLKFLSRDSVEKSAFGGECVDCKNEPPLDSVGPIRHFGSSTHWSFDSEWPSVMSDPGFGAKCHGEGQFVDKNAHERCVKYDISDGYDYLADGVIKDRAFHFDDVMQNSSSRENCSLSSRTNVCADFKCYDTRSKEDNCGFLKKHNPDNELFPKHSDIFSDETDLLCLDSGGKYNSHYGAVTSCRISSSIYSDKHENQKDQILYQEEENVYKRRPRRSHSAPPFYRGKKKFFALNNRLTTDIGKPKIYTNDDAHISQETSEWKQSQKRSSGVCQLHSESNAVEDPLIYARSDKKKAPDAFDIQKLKNQKKLEATCIYDMHLAKDVEDPLASGIKWQKSFPKTANGETLRHCHSEDTILDISSGILHLAGDSLIPESVNKNCLEDARVLQQVDKKFIPVVGCGILALIDQHAADERIRLEELRQKVLSGEKKTITYLDTEQKLVLPEVGYQLLHNYGEQIQNWGWLCNIHAPGSMSFNKNLNLLHKQQTAVTLLAVPCILGVNLTDGDLLEFLQQLADTDGSSTIPPSVHRVLNSKACRGAIMFGDTLLPSECSLIVEELKQTSLCFQCAHGRPTTVPLVNLEALHKQITKLGTWNDGSSDLWHRLRRHEVSLERAAQRLTAARG